MKTSKFGIEQLNDRVVLTAGIRGLVNEAPEPTPIVFVGGWGAASYQYANETTYDQSPKGDTAKGFTSQETEAKDIVFVGGWGSSMYQYG